MNNSLAAHFKKNKVLGVIILFALLMIPLIIFSLISPSAQTKEQKPAPTEQPTTQPINTITKPTITNNPYFQEEITYAWGPVDFSEEDLQGLNPKQQKLNDGSILYAFDSENPNRPDMIIVKDNIIIFTRQVVYQAKTDNSIAANGKPEYTLRGPSFYNSDSIIYAYPKRGTAFIADPKNNIVFEQFIFKSTTIEEFNQKYKQYSN